jgi:hypothetical protein
MGFIGGGEVNGAAIIMEPRQDQTVDEIVAYGLMELG